MIKKNELEQKIEKHLLKVEKPARYIGGELNSVKKKVNSGTLRFAFAFPDLYEIGMSNLGMQIIYKILNDLEGVYCERTFAPAVDFEEVMRREGIPLYTLETKTPVKEMDVLGFTLQYEMSATNLVNLLDLAGIPVFSQDRGEEDPFVIAGGPCTYNPEPFADLIDFFFIGESEEALPEIMAVLRRWKDSGKPKKDFLEMISQVEGVYVPSFYDVTYGEDGRIQSIEKNRPFAPERVCKRIVEDLEKADFPEATIVPFISTVHDRAMVEIFRGCTRGCRFCQAGMIYRPVRERSRKTIETIAKCQLKNTGYEELSILSLSTGDYSQVEPLVEELMGVCRASDVSMSLPSLRLDSFSFRVMEEIQGYKKSGLTFAPEAGTQRLRNIINKDISDEEIFSAARQAFELGWNTIKLYFMIGLPGETDEDLDGIAEIARKMVWIYKEIHGGKVGRLGITVSVSNFVPKGHTPFQWMAQDTEAEFTRKHLYLKEKIRPMKQVRLNYHDSKTSYLEAVLARGDRRLAKVLVEAVRLGCKFDGWGEHFKYELWMKAFENTGIDPDFYACRQRAYDEIFPWRMIDCGVSDDYFRKENQRAMEGIVTRDCRKGCTGCGVNQKFICGKKGEGSL